MPSKTDQVYMDRCLQLAAKGAGHVSPNPMVGAVLVKDEKVIGEGFHAQYGHAHAEINAINQVPDKRALSKSTLYVNLEPCSHQGQTPPCSERIINEGIPRVVIGCRDESAKVQGKGIQQLEEAGIEVLTGVEEEASKWLNRRFLTFHTLERPYIILKWAQTSDGFMADPSGNSRWISNPYSRIYVHKWRAEEDAIMVGYNTAKMDKPKLTARAWEGPNPVRLVTDPDLTLDPDHPLANNEAPTFFFHQTDKENQEGSNHYIPLSSFDKLPGTLYLHNTLSLLVEGGSQLLNHFIRRGLWNEARIFYSPVWFKKGLKAPEIMGTQLAGTMIGRDELKWIENS